MSDDRTSLFVMTGATIALWGLWGFFGKLALDKGMSPLAIFYLEILASLACVGIVVAVKHFHPAILPAPGPAAWNVYGLISGVGLAAGLLFYYLSLYRAQASLIVPLTAAYPVVTTLLSVAFLRERLSASQWLGVLLVVAGVILLLYGPALPAHSPQPGAQPEPPAHG